MKQVKRRPANRRAKHNRFRRGVTQQREFHPLGQMVKGARNRPAIGCADTGGIKPGQVIYHLGDWQRPFGFSDD